MADPTGENPKGASPLGSGPAEADQDKADPNRSIPSGTDRNGPARTWTVEFEAAARKELERLDHQAQKTILRYLRDRIATPEDPRRFGEPLRKNLADLWKYRIGDYRLVCSIEEDRVVVLVFRQI